MVNLDHMSTPAAWDKVSSIHSRDPRGKRMRIEQMLPGKKGQKVGKTAENICKSLALANTTLL